MFTRQHYEFLADFFRVQLAEAKDKNVRDATRRTVLELAKVLKGDNERFSTDRFLRKVGLL